MFNDEPEKLLIHAEICLVQGAINFEDCERVLSILAIYSRLGGDTESLEQLIMGQIGSEKYLEESERFGQAFMTSLRTLK